VQFRHRPPRSAASSFGNDSLFGDDFRYFGGLGDDVLRGNHGNDVPLMGDAENGTVISGRGHGGGFPLDRVAASA